MNIEERNELIVEYSNFAWWIAKKFKNNGFIDQDEVDSIAIEGLIYAVEKYTDKYGMTIKSYINMCVRHKIIAEITKCKNQAKYYKTVSYNQTVDISDEDEVSYENLVGEVDEGFERIEYREMLDLIISTEDIVDMGLTERDLDMFIMYHEDKKRTYTQVARAFNIPETNCFITIKKIKAKIAKKITKLKGEGKL